MTPGVVHDPEIIK